MPYLLELENSEGMPTGFRAALDLTDSHGHGEIISLAITDSMGLRVARGECDQAEFRSLAQGDWDSNVRLPLPEEKEFESPIAIQMRAYPLGMLEATFAGHVQYLQRAHAFEGLRTLLPGQ